jgi:outer membrane protein insertion porin family
MVRVAVLALAVCLGSQAERIARIRISSTSPNVDADALQQVILGHIVSKPGTEYSLRRVSEDVKALMKSGSFEDVKVETNKLPGDEVELVFVVLPKRMVRSFVFVGNKEFKDKKLRSILTHPAGAPLDEGLLARDIAEMVKKYRSSGYYGATVNFELKPVPDTSDVNVVLQVKEGPRAKLEKVTFVGNNVFKASALRKSVRTRRPWWRYIFRWGNYYNPDMLVVDKDLLRKKYSEEGYLDFKVERVEEKFSANSKWVTLVFHLSEGGQYSVSKISISGNERFATDKLSSLVKLKPGDTYRASAEEADTEALRREYEPLGYLDLRCYPVHSRDPQTHTVGIEFRIREGSPSHIRDIMIVGNTVTKDSVIRRELAIQPGDLGDAGKVRQSESRLKNLNYFEKVEIVPLATDQEDLRDLRISLAEKRTGQLMVGGTFSSEDSLVGFVEVTQSNFDWRNWPSFRGAGQRMRVRAQLGSKTSSFLASFTEPWWLDRQLRLDLELFMNTRYEDEYDETDTGFGMTVTRPWKPNWRQSFGLRIRHVSLDEFDDELYADTVNFSPGDPEYTDSRLLTDMEQNDSVFANRFTYSMVRDTRNRPSVLFPTSGSRFSVNGELITSLLGSYSDYYILSVDGTKYFPVFRKSVLKVRGRVGLADELSGDDIGVFDRFFAGGSGSIRGFDRREVGPVDDNGRESPYGGRTMFLGSVELIRPFASWVHASVFTDFGNVWEDAYDVGGGINASVGVGLRLQLPIGPINLAYGFPVITDQDHLDGNGGRLHFNIGTSF